MANPRYVSHKDVGGYSRTLPKARGEDPAELPQEVTDWLKRNYGNKHGNDMDSRDGSDEEPSGKLRRTRDKDDKEAKDKENRKSKSKKRASSSDVVVPSKAPKKTKAETSDDDDNDDNDKETDKFPDGGYKLEMMKNKKGRGVPCLFHPHLKTMLEMDPEITWKVKEDSEGISYIWDVSNKNKTRMMCSKVAKNVLAPHLLKGLGSHSHYYGPGGCSNLVYCKFSFHTNHQERRKKQQHQPWQRQTLRMVLSQLRRTSKFQNSFNLSLVHLFLCGLVWFICIYIYTI